MRALDACGITAYDPANVGSGPVGPANGIDKVTGMGLVSPARDAGKYAGLGTPPDIDPRLDTDPPAWVITTATDWVTDPWELHGRPFRNPTCVVIQGVWAQPMWFVTGDRQNPNGAVSTPLAKYAPVWRLPPLAP